MEHAQAQEGNPSLSPPEGDDTGEPRDTPGARRRWCKGTRLLVAATAAWITYLVLLILFAGRWWVWSVFEATPPVTAVVVPLLLLAFVWFARPVRRWLSVVLVLLLLAGAYLAGYGRGWSGATSASGGIKVFAWNTGYWEMWDDRDDFYAFLRRQDADVYLLQEYLHAKEAAPYNHVFRIDESARLRAEFPGYHLSVDSTFVTLSRLPIVATHHEHVPGTGSQWFWKAAKNQRTDIRIDGRTVSFYNVHLPTPFRLGDNPFRGSLSGVFTSQTARLIEKQATWRLKELDRLRADLAGNPNPAVVAGDFNTPWMELYPLGSGTEGTLSRYMSR